MNRTDPPDLDDLGPSIPAAFRADLAGRPGEPGVDGDTWLRALPGIVRDVAREWELTADGAVRHGSCAIVVPVRRHGEPAALKVGWPHAEARHEHLALRAWAGAGAVRLLAADPHRSALLLERLDPDRDLEPEPIIDACETIGTLMRRLDRPALPRLDRLADRVPGWLDRLRRGHPGVPRRMTEQAHALLPRLARDAPERLVHEDLHFANVLAAEREPWLAIDPKPVAAPWEYAVAPALWNRAADTAAAYRDLLG